MPPLSKPSVMRRRRSAAGDQLTELVLAVFRLNGLFLAAAAEITTGSGLTAARWQVLGAVLPGRLTVADAARAMGLARQSVQRLADLLVTEGLCTYQDNPAHRRAKLLAPTAAGWAAIDQIRPIQIAWANQVSAVVGEAALRDANATLRTLTAALATPAGRVRRSARDVSRAGRRSGPGRTRA
jgi:DNA-binding MarR family transcriptional regulator